MKKVAHRIHKNHPWLTPVERLVQFVLDQPNFSCPVGPSSLNNRETLILRNAHCSAPKRLPYGVAVISTLAALCVAHDRVPRLLSPFDFAFAAQACFSIRVAFFLCFAKA